MRAIRRRVWLRGLFSLNASSSLASLASGRDAGPRGLSGILCRGPLVVHARNLSSNMVANCVFAWLHSLGGIFHSPAA